MSLGINFNPKPKRARKSSCYWAGKISPVNQIWFENAQDALDQGYRPCQSS